MSRYLDLFLEESREHLGSSYELVDRLEQAPEDLGALRELMRRTHSLKGMSATMSYHEMVAVAHALEDLCEALIEGGGVRGDLHIPLLGDGLACLASLVDQVEGGQAPAHDRSAQITAELRELAGAGEAVPTAVPMRKATVENNAEEGADPTEATAPSLWRVSFSFFEEDPSAAGQTAALLHGLAAIGEIRHVCTPNLRVEDDGIRGRITAILAHAGPEAALENELRGLPGARRFSVHPESGEVVAEGPQRRSASWTRVRADLLDDLFDRIHDLLFELGRLDPPDVASPLHRVEFLIRDLCTSAQELRLVPFSTVSHRLNTCVRQLSRELGKPVRFRIVGGEVLLDRSVMDRLQSPLLHLLRNAMDHGIETLSLRQDAGKPAEGRILLEVERISDRVRIALRDDGGGMRIQELTRIALGAGVIDDLDASALNTRDALQLATLPSVSTAEKLTEISGRGMGLYEVREAVDDLGGRLEIDSDPGSGSEFRLDLPIALALVPALLFRCSGDLFALPLSAIEGTIGLTEYRRRETTTEIELTRLDEKLGLDRIDSPDAPESAIVRMEFEGRRLGLVVDEVVGKRDLAVRPLRSPLAGLTLYTGAALIDDGSITLVLDPEGLRAS